MWIFIEFYYDHPLFPSKTLPTILIYRENSPNNCLKQMVLDIIPSGADLPGLRYHLFSTNSPLTK